jgi:hypothetical protein
MTDIQIVITIVCVVAVLLVPALLYDHHYPTSDGDPYDPPCAQISVTIPDMHCEAAFANVNDQVFGQDAYVTTDGTDWFNIDTGCGAGLRLGLQLSDDYSRQKKLFEIHHNESLLPLTRSARQNQISQWTQSTP